MLIVFVVQFFAGSVSAGEIKRIAYVELGPFWLFSFTLRAIRAELNKSEEWEFIFPDELRLSPGWDATASDFDRLTAMLQDQDDVDLIIAAGTAGVRSVLRTNTGKIPIIGIGMADPIAARIVLSDGDSGIDNFTTIVIPDRWKHMIRVFHDVVQFSRLGIIYPTGEEGKIYAGLEDVQAVAEELGFEVLAREIPDENVESCADGINWLAEAGMDAFLIGPLNGFDLEDGDSSYLLSLLNRTHQIPTFARDGSFFVQSGALLGFSTWDFSRDGRNYADKILRVLAGVMPRSLPMRSTIEPLIAVNIQTALEIGFDLPFDVLIVADEIYVQSSRPSLK